MRLTQVAASALLASALWACQRRKERIFLDSAWSRDYATNACEIYKRSLGVNCIKTPEQMATELRLRFASAVLQSPACKDVTITNEPLGEQNLKEYESAWSLSFNVGSHSTLHSMSCAKIALESTRTGLPTARVSAASACTATGRSSRATM